MFNFKFKLMELFFSFTEPTLAFRSPAVVLIAFAVVSAFQLVWFHFKDSAYYYRSNFAWFMTMRGKQILARPSNGIQKEN